MNCQTVKASVSWKDVNAVSAGDYERKLIALHGFSKFNFIGKIGNGTHTHLLRCVAKRIKHEHPYVYEVASCYSYCGSAKWKSRLYIIDDASTPTCKKCNWEN